MRENMKSQKDTIIDEETAIMIRDNLLRMFPNVMKSRRKILEKAKKDGWVTTLAGTSIQLDKNITDNSLWDIATQYSGNELVLHAKSLNHMYRFIFYFCI
jgi:hypothetical protein